MIRGNSEEMMDLIALKVLHPTHSSKGTVHTLLDSGTTLLIIILGKLGARKIKVHQTILVNKSHEFLSSNTVRE